MQKVKSIFFNFLVKKINHEPKLREMKLKIMNSITSYLSNFKLPLRQVVMREEEPANRKNSLENSAKKLKRVDNDLDPEEKALGKRAQVQFDFEDYLSSDVLPVKKLKIAKDPEIEKLRLKLFKVVKNTVNTEKLIRVLDILKSQKVACDIKPDSNCIYLDFSMKNGKKNDVLGLKIFIQDDIIVTVEKTQDIVKVIKKASVNIDKSFEEVILILVQYWMNID